MADDADAMTTRTVKAYHEAGHAVYACLVGMKLETVTTAVTTFAGNLTPRDQVKSLFAGQVAERFSPLNDPYLNLYMQDYHDMVKPLAHIYAAEHGGDPKDAAGSARREVWSIQYREDCHKETEMLLTAPHQRAIMALADLLVAEETVSGERASEVIATAISASSDSDATVMPSLSDSPAPSPKPQQLSEILSKWFRRR